MERLLVLKLDTQGCEAEASVNGIPVARSDAARPSVVLPVHEYTLAGINRLELTVGPPPAAAAPDATAAPPLAQVSDGDRFARLRILLPRAGSPADEGHARELGSIDWAPPAMHAYQPPLHLRQDIDLPVDFARWRWLDAPLATVTPALHAAALDLLRELAQELAEGRIESFIARVRLRTDELAAAYAQPIDEATERLRGHLAGLHAAGCFAWAPLEAPLLILRRLAGGRLLECLDATGAPALRTLPDATGTSHRFPLRLAAVDGKLYVLR